ncbi:hypothetical protein DIPPA_24448 [Diplonema papillatum]|nr:hypothetical protein DIPPA_24448 [Diplonema papillatum]
METVNIILIIIGVLLLVLVTACLVKGKELLRSGGDLGSPLMSKEEREKAAKRDPGVGVIHQHLSDLKVRHDRMLPEHVRLLQQDIVNRKIFEQLNNQQKHINEIVSSQDKILRQHMGKIDVIERQEECIIEKIDEFMRETIQETAREIHNETEYHQYRHRKLQQTLLQQAAERTAGMLDTTHLEQQISELRVMFHRAQEERQSLVATLTAVNTGLGQVQLTNLTSLTNPIHPSDTLSSKTKTDPLQTLNSLTEHGQTQREAQGTPHEPPHKPSSPTSPSTAPNSPVLVQSAVLTSTGSSHPGRSHRSITDAPRKFKAGPSATFPYPFSSSAPAQQGEQPPSNRLSAASVATSLPTPATATRSTLGGLNKNVPAALKKKRLRDAAADPLHAQPRDQSAYETGAEEWWRSLGSSATSALRPSATFEQAQGQADSAVRRTEQAILGSARADSDPSAAKVKPKGKSSYGRLSSVVSFAETPAMFSSTVGGPAVPSSVPPHKAEQHQRHVAMGDDDDDLAYTMPRDFGLATAAG